MLCILCILSLLPPIVLSGTQEYYICVKPGLHNECQQLGRYTDEGGVFRCVESLHSVDCLLNIESGKASLAMISSEEALLAANFTSNIQVIAEKHTDSDPPAASVVIVKANFEGGLRNLKKKSYCHPGFKFEEMVTPLILEELEVQSLAKSGSDIRKNEVTIVENHIRAISEFFGPSCRPGPWTTDALLDKQLKEDYSSLCSLCKSKDCKVTSDEPFSEVLNCLVHKDADVAVTLYEEAKIFFSDEENAKNYKYLCRDGTTSSADQPCVWTKQMPYVLVTNRQVSHQSEQITKKWLVGYSLENEEMTSDEPYSGVDYKDYFLVTIGFDKRRDKIIFLSPKSLADYTEEYRTIPRKLSTQNNLNVMWCTTSEQENQKCKWLSQASLNRGLQPVLECITQTDKRECIKDERTDIVTVDVDHAYAARTHHFHPLAFPLTYLRDMKTVLVVLRADFNVDGFEGLRHKSLCLPKYGGLEFVAFTKAGLEKNILRPTESCEYSDILSDFIDDSCIPGSFEEKSSNDNTAKMCRLCVNSRDILTNENCRADETNRYYGNEGALLCLVQVGDYAVVTKQTDYSIDTSQFRVLCRNGSLASYPGLDVDSECALTVVSDGEVSFNSKKISKKDDTKLLLQEYEKWFGIDRRKPFELFNEFNGVKDLLFKDATPGLEFNISNNVYVKKYVDLFSQVDACTTSSTAVHFLPLAKFLVSLLWTYFMTQMIV